MDIVQHNSLPIAPLDALARAVLGAATYGVSVGEGSTRIHLQAGDLPAQRRASDLLKHFDSLRVSASSGQLIAGGAGSTIRCQDERLAGDRQLAYVVLRDGVLVAQGRSAVADGQWQWQLRPDKPGALHLLVYRRRGDYASGLLQIEVAAS